MRIETCDFCQETSKNDKIFIYRKVDDKDCCEKCLMKIRKSCNHFYIYSTSSYGQGDGLHKVLKCKRCGFIIDPYDKEFYDECKKVDKSNKINEAIYNMQELGLWQ